MNRNCQLYHLSSEFWTQNPKTETWVQNSELKILKRKFECRILTLKSILSSEFCTQTKRKLRSEFWAQSSRKKTRVQDSELCTFSSLLIFSFFELLYLRFSCPFFTQIIIKLLVCDFCQNRLWFLEPTCSTVLLCSKPIIALSLCRLLTEMVFLICFETCILFLHPNHHFLEPAQAM